MLFRCLIVGAVKADRTRELAALVYKEDTVMRHCLSRHRHKQSSLGCVHILLSYGVHLGCLRCSRACFGPGRVGLRDCDVFRLAGGYASHLLIGVRATATCLYNGSVLTLYYPVSW
jgi:hypothetical protein